MAKSKQEAKSWVLLAPEAALQDKGETSRTADIIKLRHPRTRQAAMYLLSADNKAITEIMIYGSGKKGSWFVDDTVQEDGKMYIATAVDVLFLCVPYLANAHKLGRTLPLEDLLVDEDFPETFRLLKCDGLKYLSSVADRKGSEDLNAWSYNETKTLNWLKAKTEKVAAALEKQNIAVDGSAVSNTFIMSSKLRESSDSQGYLNYACGLISEYLTDDTTAKLRLNLGLPDEETQKRKSSADRNTAKRAKLDMAQGVPSEADLIKSAKKPTPKAPTAKEKSQLRAAAGSKSITSFFKKK